MLALGVRYLNGFVAAAEPGSRELPEWPPHPGRVFMALAAAHFQTGAEPTERKALEWLEGLPAPLLRAGAAHPRAAVTHYVPVNDAAGPSKALLHSLPLSRDRQPRTFARAWLDDEVVYFAWREAEPSAELRLSLESLSAKVTRLGHSSSLVQMWTATPDEVPGPNWQPDTDRAEVHLRVVGPGTIEDLERRYNQHGTDGFADLLLAADDDSDKAAQKAARKRLKSEFQNEPPPRIRPELSLYQGYARVELTAAKPAVPGTVFSPHLIVLVQEPKEGPYQQLDLPCTLAVTQRWREALLSHSNDLPERVRHIVSGHDRDSQPLSEPHLAFMPIAFVGHAHADGHLLGMAIVLPETLATDTRRDVLRAFGQVSELKLGRLGVWTVHRETGSRPSWNLRPETWTAHPNGATHWATVTPIVFDRHAKSKDRAEYQREVAASIAASCQTIGLPKPREVIVTAVSAHLGVPPTHAFPRLQRKDNSERRHTHAILVFDQPVRGPMLIGAGRYRGHGVCRAMDIGNGESLRINHGESSP